MTKYLNWQANISSLKVDKPLFKCSLPDIVPSTPETLAN